MKMMQSTNRSGVSASISLLRFLGLNNPVRNEYVGSAHAKPMRSNAKSVVRRNEPVASANAADLPNMTPIYLNASPMEGAENNTQPTITATIVTNHLRIFGILFTRLSRMYFSNISRIP